MLDICKKEFFMAYGAQNTAASTLHVSHSKLFNKCLLYNLEYTVLLTIIGTPSFFA